MQYKRFQTNTLWWIFVVAIVCLVSTPLASEPLRRGRDVHWSLQPIEAGSPPSVEDTSWVRNDIDAFVLSRLEARNVRPSPPASRNTLLRRLSLDLIGLPTLPEELDSFTGDPHHDAHERLVDRLLASPHHGERWGRYWLDMAHYADTNGYTSDEVRPNAWRWREWVIGALNKNVPFDKFTLQQLAGDLLPGSTIDDRVATGFYRNTLRNNEGGIDPEHDRVKRTVDRTNTVAQVWLGITMGCCQCHAHKYDPITQEEYFSFYSFFNTLNEIDTEAAGPHQVEAYVRHKATHDAEHEKILASIRDYEEKELQDNLRAWDATRPRPAHWQPLRAQRLSSKVGKELSQGEDLSVFVTRVDGRLDTYVFVAETDLEEITAIRLEVLPDDRLPSKGPGQAGNGNFVLTDFRVFAAPADDEAGRRRLTLENPSADFSSKTGAVSQSVDGDPFAGWEIHPRAGKRHFAIYETERGLQLPGRTLLTFELQHGLRDYHNIGKFRISVTSTSRPPGSKLVEVGIVDALGKSPETRSEEERVALLDYFRTVDPRSVDLARARDRHAAAAPHDPRRSVRARAVVEPPEARETRVHLRGDFRRKGEVVSAGVPVVLPELTPRGPRPDRLDLARWILSRQNPLTARVIVNRVWQQYFGRGLVVSESDFGTQGEPPSHPELLDWLAEWFRESEWNLKALHRLIVTSATYRQSSVARPELADRDPYNTWLARQNRLRVEAEIIRDLALASSGLLHLRVGGPSVRPPQPADVARLGFNDDVKWQTSTGVDRHRRGLYTFFQRTVPYPMLLTFDAPDSNNACTLRDRSNTPLQALTLWNDPVFLEAARALGRRIVHEVPAGDEREQTITGRLRHIFRVCLSRDPSVQEVAIARSFFEAQLTRLEDAPESVAQIVEGVPLRDSAEDAELAAWITVARTLINMDEFITRE